MIDSLNFTISKQIDLNLLQNYTSKIFESGEVIYHTWKFGHLDIIINPNYNTTKVKGSIRKYFLGETELGDLTFEQLSTALNRLRRDLHLSHAEFSESIITRIDVGTTIPVEGNIHDYLHAITSYPRLEKVTYDDSIEFKGAFKKLIFYNKVLKESMTNKGMSLFYHGRLVKEENLLRFEVQYRRVSALQDQLSGIRKMNQVLDQSHLLWDMALTEMAKVVFSSTGILKPVFEIKDTSQVLSALILFAFRGTREPSQLVDEWYDRGLIKYNHKHNVLNKLQEMAGNLSIENNPKDQLYREFVYKILNSSLPYIIQRYFTPEESHKITRADLNGEIEV